MCVEVYVPDITLAEFRNDDDDDNKDHDANDDGNLRNYMKECFPLFVELLSNFPWELT